MVSDIMTVEVPVVKVPSIDMDNPWKHGINFYFRQFMELCLPEIAEKIDWSRGYEVLDKEFLAISRGVKIGKRVADKLIKVYEKNGNEAWLLAHVELQGEPEVVFPERMLVYRYRARDYFGKSIISIAILMDNNPKWRPNHYRESFYDSSLEINYLVVKILDYKHRVQELEAIDNPFAMLILAQLAVLETRGKPGARLKAKTALTRQLYAKGWDKDKIIQIYTLIDWLVALPEELMIKYNVQVKQIEEEQHMNFVTTAERVGIKIGVQQGIQQGIQQGKAEMLIQILEYHFGKLPEHYLKLISEANGDALSLWNERLFKARTLEDVFDAAS